MKSLTAGLGLLLCLAGAVTAQGRGVLFAAARRSLDGASAAARAEGLAYLANKEMAAGDAAARSDFEAAFSAALLLPDAAQAIKAGVELDAVEGVLTTGGVQPALAMAEQADAGREEIADRVVCAAVAAGETAAAWRLWSFRAAQSIFAPRGAAALYAGAPPSLRVQLEHEASAAEAARPPTPDLPEFIVLFAQVLKWHRAASTPPAAATMDAARQLAERASVLAPRDPDVAAVLPQLRSGLDRFAPGAGGGAATPAAAAPALMGGAEGDDPLLPILLQPEERLGRPHDLAGSLIVAHDPQDDGRGTIIGLATRPPSEVRQSLLFAAELAGAVVETGDAGLARGLLASELAQGVAASGAVPPIVRLRGLALAAQIAPELAASAALALPPGLFRCAALASVAYAATAGAQPAQPLQVLQGNWVPGPGAKLDGKDLHVGELSALHPAPIFVTAAAVDVPDNRIVYRGPEVHIVAETAAPHFGWRIAGLYDPEIQIPRGATVVITLVNLDWMERDFLLLPHGPPFGDWPNGPKGVWGFYAPGVLLFRPGGIKLLPPRSLNTIYTATSTYYAASVGQGAYLNGAFGAAEAGDYGRIVVVP